MATSNPQILFNKRVIIGIAIAGITVIFIGIGIGLYFLLRRTSKVSHHKKLPSSPPPNLKIDPCFTMKSTISNALKPSCHGIRGLYTPALCTWINESDINNPPSSLVNTVEKEMNITDINKQCSKKNKKDMLTTLQSSMKQQSNTCGFCSTGKHPVHPPKKPPHSKHPVHPPKKPSHSKHPVQPPKKPSHSKHPVQPPKKPPHSKHPVQPPKKPPHSLSNSYNCDGAKHFVPNPDKKTNKCGSCVRTEQCKKGHFCCPYMKKCITEGDGCAQPNADCNPSCFDNDDPTKCTCNDKNFPYKWVTCPNSDPPLSEYEDSSEINDGKLQYCNDVL